MKAMDLLVGFGSVKDSYVISAEEFRQGKQKAQIKRLSMRKAWLIAAVIALMLLLVGCTIVYVLRMQDLKVGEYSFYVPTEYDENGNVIPVESQEPITLLSLQSYKYFDLTNTGVFIGRFRPCEGNVFEVWCEDFGMYQHYFYQANAESAVFLTGVTHDTADDVWYLILTDGVGTESKQPITQEEAQEILNSYTRIDINWFPLKKFGQEDVHTYYTDPYAQYIAYKLDRYDNAANYEYTLMDVNGDGIDELITREEAFKADGTSYPILRIHSIRDGELWDMNMGTFAYVCEGGILEETLDFLEDGDRGEYWQYYRCTENGAEPIEKIVRDPYTLYWGRVQAGKEGRTVTEEEAMAVRNSHKRMELDMKPFPKFPLK